MEKRCLFIDDNPDDVRSVLENIKEVGKAQGIEVRCDLLELSSEYYNDSGDFDPGKIKEGVHGQLADRDKYQLVACDFDIEDDNLNGLDIVKILREKDRTCVVILYSGNLNKIADHISRIGNQKERFKRIKTLVGSNITVFIDRGTEFEADLIHILKKQIPLEVTIEMKLREHADLKFKHGYDMFRGKTLGEIASEINVGSIHGNKFKEEIIERGIAHMIDLNQA